MFHVFDLFFILCRRGLVGLPTRLTNKGRAGSVQAGTDDGSLQDESSLDGEDSEKQWKNNINNIIIHATFFSSNRYTNYT